MKSRPRILLAASIALLVAGVLFLPPRPAAAQFGGAVAVIKDIPAAIGRALDKTKDLIKTKAKVAADIAFKNSLNVYLGQIAQDTAVWLSTGAPGQKPLFLTDKKYFAKLNDAAAGDFLDTLSRGVFGQSLCAPPLQKQLQIERAVRDLFTVPSECADLCRLDYNRKVSTIPDLTRTLVPKTVTQVVPGWVIGPPQGNRWTIAEAERNVSELREEQRSGTTVKFTRWCVQEFPPPPPNNNWLINNCIAAYERNISEARASASADLRRCTQDCRVNKRIARCSVSDIRNNLQNPAKLSETLSSYFRPEQNDIGQILTIYGLTSEQQSQAVQNERDLLTFSGIGPLRSRITGDVLTPSDLTRARAQQTIQESTSAEKIQTGSSIADYLKPIAGALVTRVIKRFFNTKCGLNPEACRGPSGATSRIGSLLFGPGISSIQAAQLRFASLARIDYITGDPSRSEIAVTDQLVADGIIDARFKQAIDEKMTVREALDKGLLDKQKTFGFDQNGIEPVDGYPYRSMVFLRKYRVIPVGWELAAQYTKHSGRSASIGELVDTFDKLCEANCDDPDPNNNVHNPFYHLVDPNWVLKAPQTYCRRQGAGEEVLSREFVCDEDNVSRDGNVLIGEDAPNCIFNSVTNPNPDQGNWIIQRSAEECVDDLSCVSENDDGSCLAYGYCIEERPIWRFGGDICDPQNTTCTRFTDEDGVEVAYNANTVDVNGCTEEVAGCQWYCNEYDEGNARWDCRVNTANGTIEDFTGAPQTPANGGIRYFDRDATTCEATAEGCTQFIRTGPGINALPNGNFEYLGVNDEPDDLIQDSFQGWDKWGGVQTFAVTSDNAGVGTANQTAARIASGNAADYIYYFFDTGFAINDRTFTLSYYGRAESGSCTGRAGLEAFGSAGGSQEEVAADYTTSWQRYSVSLTLDPPPPTGQLYSSFGVETFIRSGQGCDIIVDNAQTEETNVVNAFADYGQANQLHLNKTRLSCTADEVGCERYTPREGGDPIPGVVRPPDLCPADEVGCRAWREMPITQVPQRPAEDPVYFRAGTGTQCSATYVGCEEYTNLDEVAQGGEGIHYYSQIRLCAEPGDPGVTTYYSWQGNEETGYQLRTHSLLRSNLDNGPCTNATVPSPGQPTTCNDAAGTQATCTAADLPLNPDCTEYFDLDLNPYYRLRSRTVTASDDCHPFRNTIDEQQGNTVIYPIIPGEAVTCPASFNGCREYKGNAGNNIRVILGDDFEDGDTVGWNGGTISTESLRVGGHSMRVASPSVVHDVAGLVAEGRSYTVSFYAKKDAAAAISLNARFQDGLGLPLIFAPLASIPLSDDWNFYTLGPVFYDRAPGPAPTFEFFTGAGDPYFLDAIVLREITDSVFLVKGTQDSCDAQYANCAAYTDRGGQTHTLRSFTRLCREQSIGCEAMLDTKNSATPFDQTVKGVLTPVDETVTLVNNPAAYCRAEDKGCNRFGKPTLVPNDVNRLVRIASTFATVWLKNDPDQHDGILCEASDLLCREYANEDTGSLVYFRDPLGILCEYRRGVSGEFNWFISGTNDLPCPSQDLVDFCEERTVAGVRQFCYKSSTQDTCDRPCVTRLCPGEQSGCTEYRDPSDPADCRSNCTLEINENTGDPRPVNAQCQPPGPGETGLPGCRAYYYIRQSLEEGSAECGSQINVEGGCRPFNDTSNPELNFRGR